MRVLTRLLLSLTVLVTTVFAIHEADVGVVDWHKHLVGVPLITAPVTVPSFHLTGNGNESVILTATGSNVLAALNPDTGAVLWRYIYEPEDGILGYYKSPKTVATLSGVGGATLRLFNVTTGAVIVEKQLHHPTQGAFSDPPYFGKQVVFSDDASLLYVLSNGYTVTCVDTSSGDVKWTWTAPDQGSLILFNKLTVTDNTVYILGFGASIASYTLHATTLNPQTGQLLTSLPLNAKITDPLSGFTVLKRTDLQRPVAVWIDNGIVQYVVLGPELKEKTRPVKGTGYEQLIEVGRKDEGECVVMRSDGSAFVLKFEGDVNSVKSLGEIGGTLRSEELADSLYAGGRDLDGSSFVSRFFWSHKEEIAYAHIFDSTVSKYNELVFDFDTKIHGVIAHVALDPSASPHPRFLITTSTGAVQLWSSSDSSSTTSVTHQVQWTREESLATTAVAEFVELPERAAVISLNAHADEGYVDRVVRHVWDLRGLPGYIVGFVKRFAGGGYASVNGGVDGDSTTSSTTATTTPPTADGTNEKLSRDAFGFRQIIVVATHFGKIYGLDSSNGEIVWSRVMGLGWAGQLGGRVQPVKMFVTKKVGDVDANGVGGDPEVVVVAQRRADNSLVDTVVFHINAVTGADAAGRTREDGVLDGYDAIQGPLVEAYLLNAEEKIVVMLDEFLQVFLYPETEHTLEIFRKEASKLSFPLKTTIENRSRIVGHQISPSTTFHAPPPPPTFNEDNILSEEEEEELELQRQQHRTGPRSVAHPVWTLTLPENEIVQQIVAPTVKGNVASLGKVLGDRSTLYKYLNPRMFVVVSRDGERGVCGIRVVDGGKGSVVYQGEVGGTSVGIVKRGAGEGGEGGERVVKKCDVRVALIENWLVYHWYDESGDSGAKGYRVTSVELYEGDEDEKVKTSDMSAYSNDTLSVKTFEETFVFPYAVTALGATTTKYGISSRNLIVATNNHRVQSFPRSFLDPRRPHRKPTTEEMEEGLMQYDPLVIDDQRRILSHQYDVANIVRIITAPSFLESTSLVFAHGLDMFLTRVAPSNTFDVLSESFNKAQLVFTVLGLVTGIVVVAPMVRRKKLRGVWYQS